MREKEILHAFYGPFRNTTYAILEDHGTSYRLSFDTGPEVDPAKLLNDQVTVFKFLANTIGEIRITYLYDRRLVFYGAQLPTFAVHADSQAPEGQAEDQDDPPATCGSITCGFHPCPDPQRPILICPDGVKECVRFME